MTIIIHKNELMGETSKFSIDNTAKIVRTYQQKRLVTSPNAGYNWEVAQALNYSPGEQHPSDTAATLRDMDIERQFTREVDGTVTPSVAWDLTLNYSTETTTQYEASEDPTMARPIRSWSTTSQSLYAIKDRDGDLIVNAANQPFDGGIPVTLEMPTLVIERNEYGFNGALATQYANALNSDTFSGAAPETLRLKITAQEKNQGQYNYWTVRYEMAYYWLGWQPLPVNAGLKQLKSGVLVDCLDANKNPVSSPVPLDTAGLQVPIGSLPSGANFIKVLYYRTMPFGSLGLPEN